MTLEADKLVSNRIHFIGICGTAMATVAAMLKARGWDVRGSDQSVYPPMSTFLREQGIAPLDGYRAEHITADLGLVCVGNAISRGNPELEAVLDRKVRYCSLPELVREQFLWSARSIVVAGTHGKTTTTSIVGWLLTAAGRDPSVLVGGIALNLDGSYRLPVTDGSGRDRTTLRSALKLLSEAGYDLDGTVLRQRTTKTPLTFEILVTTRDQERIALAYQRDLKRAGIEASVRAVDPVQFDQRRLGYEFDMVQNRWDQSLSPGNEQSFYFGSQAADIPGTRNYMGAKEPAIDALIAALLEAREHPAFVSAVRALDRVLMSGFYAIPVFNVQEQWIARWNRIERPAATALTGYLPETLWHRPEVQQK